MKALQIAYPLRSIRPSLGTLVWGKGKRGRERRGPINFHYFIVNASFISATSEKRGEKERREIKKERWYSDGRNKEGRILEEMQRRRGQVGCELM